MGRAVPSRPPAVRVRAGPRPVTHGDGLSPVTAIAYVTRTAHRTAQVCNLTGQYIQGVHPYFVTAGSAAVTGKPSPAVAGRRSTSWNRSASTASPQHALQEIAAESRYGREVELMQDVAAAPAPGE